MKLLKQIMEKKMELSDEFMLNRKYLRGIWQFYQVYNFALAITLFKEDKSYSRMKGILWKKWFALGGGFDEKKIKKFQLFMKKDMEVIILSFNMLDTQIEKLSYEMGDIHKSPYIGILGYEMPRF